MSDGCDTARRPHGENCACCRREATLGFFDNLPENVGVGDQEWTVMTMTPNDFVALFAREREHVVERYSERSGKAEAERLLRAASNGPVDETLFRAGLHQLVTDLYYHLLLALDGEASLGGVQQSYSVFAEDGSKVSGESGDLEALAYEMLQEPEDEGRPG